MLDFQRISILDPKTGKSKRKVPKLSTIVKTLVAYNVSDNGLHFVGVQTNGDVIVWHRDLDSVRTISGRDDFGFKLGVHCPSVFISDDTSKIVLVTTRNKVFVWENEKPIYFQTTTASDKLLSLIGSTSTQGNNALIYGNWSDIVASKEIKSVEDNKELTVHTRFNVCPIDGTKATCCFAFNYESKLTINILRIKWLNYGEINSLK